MSCFGAVSDGLFLGFSRKELKEGIDAVNLCVWIKQSEHLKGCLFSPKFAVG